MAKKLAVPCKCGFEWDTFHICRVFTGPEPAEPPKRKSRPAHTRGEDEAVRGSDEWKQKIADARERQTEASRSSRDRRIRQFAKEFKEGASAQDLADKHGFHLGTIRKDLYAARDLGLIEIPKRPGRMRNPETRERNLLIIADRKNNMSIKDIAKKHGIRYDTCALVIRNAKNNNEL